MKIGKGPDGINPVRSYFFAGFLDKEIETID